MRLHDYAPSGNCYKVRLLLALLDRPLERVSVDIFAGDTLTDAFGRLNPARETPVLELDDGSALVQSAAILWYLAEGTAFLPGAALERAQVVRWLAFEQEWIGAVAGARFYALTGRRPEALPERRERARRALAMLEEGLAGRTWIVGEGPTIADVALFAYTHVAPDAGIDLAPWPAVRAWIGRVEALPGFMDDYVPYPGNARPGAGRSIYDGGNSASTQAASSRGRR